MGFNLADYQPVEERNAQFWAKYPEGRIHTDILFQDGTRYICRCEIFRSADDSVPAATGHAEEIVTGRGVNQTSALENCETSAEGRALARLGFAPKGARPSREEMDKANRQRAAQEKPLSEADVARAKLRKDCAENSWDLATVAGLFEEAQGVTLKEATNVQVIEAFRQSLFAKSAAELVGAA